MAILNFTDDLAIVRGDDFEYTFEFQDENCDPIDQTGNVFDASITKNGTVIEEFTVTVLNENVTLSLSNAETWALTQATNNVKWRLRQTVGSVTSTIVSGEADIVSP